MDQQDVRRQLRKLAVVTPMFLTLLALFAVLARPAIAQIAPSATTAQTQSAHADTYTLSADKLAKAIRLAHDRNILHFVSAGWSLVFLVILLATGAIAALRDWSASVTLKPWLQGFLFLPLFFLITSLGDLPLSAVEQHLSRAYGLSVQSWASWFGDQGKGLLLGLIVGTLVLSLVFLIIRHSTRRWWLWFWIISIPLEVVTIVVYPIVIDPMFNHFEPLTQSNPALVDQLERVVDRSGLQIPPSRMFLMKASEKYTGLNAYVTGLGASKRVVVWDTTIQKLPTDQILFVFGHEQGHYVLNHIWKGLIFYSAIFLVFFWISYHAVHWLIGRCGARWRVASQSDWASTALLMLILGVLTFFLEPAGNSFSRVIEHHADIYGQEVIHGIVPDPQASASASFQTLGEVWLEDPHPSHFIEFWTYSHPSVAHRMNFAAHYDPWAPGGHPRYFRRGQDR